MTATPVYLTTPPRNSLQSSRDLYAVRVENNNSYTIEIIGKTDDTSSLTVSSFEFETNSTLFDGTKTLTPKSINYHLTLPNINYFNREVRIETAVMSYSVLLTIGNYTQNAFAVELQNALNGLGIGTFACVYNNITDILTVTESTPINWRFVQCPLFDYEVSCSTNYVVTYQPVNTIYNVALINTPVIYVLMKGDINFASNRSVTNPTGISYLTSFKPIPLNKDGFYIIAGSLSIDCLEISKSSETNNSVSVGYTLLDWKGRRLSDVYGLTKGDYFSIQFAIGS